MFMKPVWEPISEQCFSHWMTSTSTETAFICWCDCSWLLINLKISAFTVNVPFHSELSSASVWEWCLLFTSILSCCRAGKKSVPSRDSCLLETTVTQSQRLVKWFDFIKCIVLRAGDKLSLLHHHHGLVSQASVSLSLSPCSAFGLALTGEPKEGKTKNSLPVASGLAHLCRSEVGQWGHSCRYI